VTDQQHEEHHAAIFASLEEIKRQLSMLQTNGAFSLTIKDKRIKFAGSVPVPKPMWIVLTLAALGGSGWLTKFLGAW